MNKYSSGCYVIDSEYNIVNMNDPARMIYPQLKIGDKCYACLMGLDHPCPPCPVANGVKGPRTYTDPIRGISEAVDAVDIAMEGHGDCHMLIFTTVEEEAAFAATLPTTAEDLKNLALVKALTVDYYDVFSVNLSSDSMTMYRHNGKPLESDSVFRKIHAYSEAAELYIRNHVTPEDQEQLRRASSPEWMRETLAEAESVMVHYRVNWHNEQHYFFRKIVRIGDGDSFDNVVIGVGCEDESVRSRELQAALQNNLRRVEYSTATGLLTKEAFFIHGDELLARYPGLDFDFCILRVENLGSVNHQYGRIAGDKVVQTIGAILKTYEKDTSCIAYFGDGMFGSLTQSTDAEVRRAAILGFRERILEASEIKNLVLNWSLYKNISRDLSAAEIYEQVAYAISTVRSSMHEDYVEFEQDLIARLDWDRSVRHGFRGALAGGEFVAWYQPKYSVHTQKIIGAEALVRWVRPDGTMVPPGKFIPALENCGLINELDEEIFRQACRLQKTMAEKGLQPVPISVNLSRASIFKTDIAQIYSEIAASFGVNPRSIPIEITESAAVRAAMIQEFSDSLIEKGFVIHMDDFGAGYSSLASLQGIPFESIKLDKSLIDFIGQRSGDSILKHTIAFAKESGMNVIAEGVETLEQFLFLKVAGCDAIQGYYFSKPVPESTFLNMLGA